VNINENSKKLSRTYLEKCPVFKCNNEAREYLEREFGDRLVFYQKFKEDAKICHIFHLILDRNAYQKGIVKLTERKWSMSDDDCINFLNSHQIIEIEENGMIYLHGNNRLEDE